jgi:6-phosphogluconolactonase
MFTALPATVPLSSLIAGGFDPAGSNSAGGAVFVLTNAPTGNAVIAYHRGADGSLSSAGTYAAGGNGTGAGLNSQGAVVATGDRRFVLAVNAGSNSISVFRAGEDGLQLLDTTPSGGVFPTSIAVSNGLVVVLNAGAPNNISGFQLSALTPLPALTGTPAGLAGLAGF